MDDLHINIKKVIDKKGRDFLTTSGFVGLLDDEHAFEDEEAKCCKNIMKELINYGYMNELVNLGKWSQPDIVNIAYRYYQQTHREKDYVAYLIECIAYGLGWIKSTPKTPKRRQAEAKKAMESANTKPISQKPQNPTSTQTSPSQQVSTSGQQQPPKKGFFSRLFNSPSAEECYQNAINAKKNNSNIEYVDWLKKAAKKGNVNAMFELGEIYSNGGVVDVDGEEALKWYQKGAEKGHTECMLNYSISCLFKEKFDMALKYAKKPADNKYVDAFAVMGICHYMTGMKSNNENDFVNAYTWLNKAVSMFNPRSNNPHDLSMDMYKSALLFLGYCYLGDIGIPKQPQKAKECIKKAVSLGSNEAKDFLEQAEKQHLFN